MEHAANLIDGFNFPAFEDSLPGAQPLVRITLVAVTPTSIDGELFNGDQISCFSFFSLTIIAHGGLDILELATNLIDGFNFLAFAESLPGAQPLEWQHLGCRCANVE